jgi:serine/threonine-protein kinase
VTNKAREVKAPDLKGKTVPEADAIVKRLGLVLKLDPTPVPDPSVPTGRVVIQDPVPGFTLRRARAVKVRVSEGMRAALVPTVNGQPERTAELALEGARLPVLARAEIRSADYSAGTVIAQDPPPGARASGVRLLINRPEEGAVYVTPDLVGLPYSRAVNVLQKQFPFRIGNGGDMLQPNLPTGTIVQQFPTAGSQIRAQDTLTLWTSR